jgi:hypothetical protein
VRLSDHAIERFSDRGVAMLDGCGDPRQRLSDLIAARGSVKPTPPRWFAGTVPERGFFIVIDDAFVLPVRPAALRGGAIPHQGWVATTFVSRRLSDADLAELDRRELGRMFLPRRVERLWAAANARRGREPTDLRTAILERGRVTK